MNPGESVRGFPVSASGGIKKRAGSAESRQPQFRLSEAAMAGFLERALPGQIMVGEAVAWENLTIASMRFKGASREELP